MAPIQFLRRMLSEISALLEPVKAPERAAPQPRDDGEGFIPDLYLVTEDGQYFLATENEAYVFILDVPIPPPRPYLPPAEKNAHLTVQEFHHMMPFRAAGHSDAEIQALIDTCIPNFNGCVWAGRQVEAEANYVAHQLAMRDMAAKHRDCLDAIQVPIDAVPYSDSCVFTPQGRTYNAMLDRVPGKRTRKIL